MQISFTAVLSSLLWLPFLLCKSGLFSVINNGHIFPFALLHILTQMLNRSVSNYSKCLDKSDNLLVLFLPGDFPLIVLHILAPTELATFWSAAQLSFENLLVVLLRLILGFLDAFHFLALQLYFAETYSPVTFWKVKQDVNLLNLYLSRNISISASYLIESLVAHEICRLKSFTQKLWRHWKFLTIWWLKLRTSTWRGQDVVHPTGCVV